VAYGFEKEMINIQKPMAEYMLVGGELEDVSMYLEEEGSFQGLTGRLAGKCEERDFPYKDIDGALFRSSGVGVTVSTRGEYLLSEIPGRWTCRVSHPDYKPYTFGFTIDSADDYVRKDVKLDCYDADNDGVCNYEDNCEFVDNGKYGGTCVCGDITTNGQPCEFDSDCKTCTTPYGHCSKNQEDCDGDGQGDACEGNCLESLYGCCYFCWW
jgi:hypothetical protein